MYQTIYRIFITVIIVLVNYNEFCVCDSVSRPSSSIIKKGTLIYTRKNEPQGQFYKTPFKITSSNSKLTQGFQRPFRVLNSTIRRGKYAFIRPHRRRTPIILHHLSSSRYAKGFAGISSHLITPTNNGDNNNDSKITDSYVTEKPNKVSEISFKIPTEKSEITITVPPPSEDIQEEDETKQPVKDIDSTTTIINLDDEIEEPDASSEESESNDGEPDNSSEKLPEESEKTEGESDINTDKLSEESENTEEESELPNKNTDELSDESKNTEEPEPDTNTDNISEETESTESLNPTASPSSPDYEYDSAEDVSENEIESIPVDSSPFISYKKTCSCGKNHTDYIVGGQPVDIEEFPWMIQLVLHIKSTIHSFCAGSIINAKYVVTAAHCVYRREPRDFFVRYGHESSDKEGDIANVEKILIHERYNHSDITKNDIALVRVETDFVYGSKVQSVCLFPDPKFDYGGVITGWGQVTVFGELADVLKGAFVKILDYETCVNKSDYNRDQLNKRVVCAKEDGTDACQGDSGGPLMIFDVPRRSYTLVGIISWGLGCAQPNYPGVYTYVPEYRDWIFKNTKDSSYCRHTLE